MSRTGMSGTGISRTGIVSRAGTFLAPGGAGPPRPPLDIWQLPRTVKETSNLPAGGCRSTPAATGSNIRKETFTKLDHHPGQGLAHPHPPTPMAIFRQYIAPLLIVLVFLVALVAVGARSFLPSDMASPAPVEETAPATSLLPGAGGALQEPVC